MEYILVRSKRKSAEIQVKSTGVVVRAPYWLAKREIDRFVEEKEKWIREKQAELIKKEKEREGQPQPQQLTKVEVQQLADKALQVIPERVAYYAPLVGVDYGRITIRNQKTRWGSCSSKGNLNFNCLLMLMPMEVVDSVVVHELCHRKEMNHSKRFYEEIRRVYPEYDKWNRWLKENGPAIMERNI